MTGLWKRGDSPVGLGVVQIAELVRSGSLSATSVVSAHLDRIELLNHQTGAFVHVDREGALQQAHGIDQVVAAGRDPGSLAGVPLGVKELHSVRGWPRTSASTAFRDVVADTTEAFIAKAVRGGAVPVGLTASSEFGLEAFVSSELHGVCRNPWCLGRTPGGSSGGSAAAVSAALVPFATGTDEGGSLRIPASFCGVVGFKATHGLVSLDPYRTDVSGINHFGFLTSRVEDMARVLDVAVDAPAGQGHPGSGPGGSYESAVDDARVSGARFGWSADLGFAPCGRAVEQVTRAAAGRIIAAAGGSEVAGDFRLPDESDSFRLLCALNLHAVLRSLPFHDVDALPAPVREYVGFAKAASVGQTAAAHRGKERLARAVDAIFTQVDFLLTPATQMPAFSASGPVPSCIKGTPVDDCTSIGLSFSFNLSGHPAISVPAGMVQRTPIGLQMVGPRYAERELLALAALWQRTQPWRCPPETAPGSAY